LKTIITTPSSEPAYSDFLRGGNIVHLPDLDTASADELLREVTAHGARGLIMSRRPPDAFLRHWCRSVPGTTYLSYVTGTPSRSAPRDLVEFNHPDGGLASIATALSGFEQSRRFRALKVWFALKAHGIESFARRSRATSARSPT
jgi:D-amino-acid dehydrogenase